MIHVPLLGVTALALVLACGADKKSDAGTTCTSFTYSAWGACADGVQTRTVVTATPAGCTGGTPVLSQACSAGTTAAPTCSPAPGTYPSTRTVTCSSTTAASTTRCTIDGSAPTSASPVCSGIEVAASLTLRAFASAPGLPDSGVVSFVYTIHAGGGTTYLVGPTRTYTTIDAVQGVVQPGDLVLIDPGDYGPATVSTPGLPGDPITYRGSGGRPVFSGGTNAFTVEADHIVIEDIETTGADNRCFFYVSDDVTLRRARLHDCPNGLQSSDVGSGSFLGEYLEIDRCGQGTSRHPVYVSSDQSANPGAVFRLRFSYLHDQLGGTPRSRAERTELHYNWLEGSTYREWECIGPDVPSGGSDLYREDCELVGNVFWKKTANVQSMVRLGGDGTGQTNGRVRLVNNTFILGLGSGPVIFPQFGLDSIELHNNVFYRPGGGGVNVLDASLAEWVAGRAISGTNNWVPTGSTNVPAEWTATVTGADPGFAGYPTNLRPSGTSALRNAGGPATAAPTGHPFPSPLTLPAWEPPAGSAETTGVARPSAGTIDIGAYESP